MQVTGVRHKFTSGKVISFPDFTVEAHSAVLLLGESGSGKTTLLHLLAGLLAAQEGQIKLLGKDIALMSESQRDQFRGKHVGMIFQKNHLIPALSVKENILMASYLSKKSQDLAAVESVLTQLNIADKLNSRVTELSQGQAQRVAIARAIIHQPSILFADEPTSALDDRSCDSVSKLLSEVAQANKMTLVIATHDQRLKSKFSQHLLLSAQ